VWLGVAPGAQVKCTSGMGLRRTASSRQTSPKPQTTSRRATSCLNRMWCMRWNLRVSVSFSQTQKFSSSRGTRVTRKKTPKKRVPNCHLRRTAAPLASYLDALRSAWPRRFRNRRVFGLDRNSHEMATTSIKDRRGHLRTQNVDKPVPFPNANPRWRGELFGS
jgi:hypothetical protein